MDETQKFFDDMTKMKVQAANEWWTPDAVTQAAQTVDGVYNLITIVCVIFFVGIIVPMFYFTWKYHRKSEEQVAVSQEDHSTFLEILWSAGPMVLLFYLFFVGFRGFLDLRVEPEGAMEVGVRAYQWGWEFQYSEDFEGNPTKCTTKVNFNEPLYLPTQRPVKFIMTSSDVLHSFYLPSFRQKGDVIPGRYNTVWVEAPADKADDYTLFCTEYCGRSHSQMAATLRFVDPPEFNKWLKEKQKTSCGGVSLKRGKQIYDGVCKTCHSLDGSKGTGPTFKGLWAKEETLEDGSKVTVDETYVQESILKPNAKIVKGYPAAMPAQELDEDEIKSMFKFLQSVK